MKLNIVSILAAGALLLAAAPVARAQAPQTTDAGVLAGQAVTNDVSVKYTVGGVEQTDPATDSVTFLVDRKVVLAVTENGSAVTQVVPGEENKALRFDVTNDSNDFIDIALAASDAPLTPTATTFKGGDGSATEEGTKDTDATFTLYLDVNTNGIYDSGTDTALPLSSGTYYLDGVAPGDTVEVLVVADEMPDNTAVTSNDVMVVQLVGTAHSAYADQRAPTIGVGSETEARTTALATPGTALLSGTLGDELDDDSATSDDDDAIDNVFADVADTTEGTGDGAGTGTDTSYDAYKVSVTTIEVTKTYGVISDGVSTTGQEPKAIPGAIVLYCIKVENNGTTDATDVTITDSIPAGTQYQAGTIQVVANTAVDCAADPAAAVTAGGAFKTDASDAPTDTADFDETTPDAITTQVDVDADDDTTTMFQVKIL